MSLRKWINKQYAKKYIATCNKSIDYYVAMINQNIPFSFSRFGDGEWNAMLGKSGANCDGHEYYPEMGKLLRKAVIDNYPYLYSIQNMAIRNEGRKISLFLKKHGVTLQWHNSDVLHYANIEGRLFPMIEALRRKKCVLIGPPHLKNLNESCFNFVKFIEIPAKNCFLTIKEIKEEILQYGHHKKGFIYSFSASMPANILIHELYPLLGKTNWLLDFGSVWDIYVGAESRGHYDIQKWEKTIKKNCKG